MPDLALGDAYRALRCRPDSAAAHNTLGTVLQALGQTKNARRAFDRALELDPDATFALNNLCYLSLQEIKAREAQQACERALAKKPLEPMLTAARTNLALAFAMQGDIPRAETQLLENPDTVAGHFNVGMLRMCSAGATRRRRLMRHGRAAIGVGGTAPRYTGLAPELLRRSSRCYLQKTSRHRRLTP
jgi:Flp pilus assembly protein TadD